MDSEMTMKEEILRTFRDKSNLQQRIYDNTFAVMGELKEVLRGMSDGMNASLADMDKRVRVEYRDRGSYEASLEIGSDLLIFSMHPNVFLFNREHILWQNSYVQNDRRNAYCGIIGIYNFLSDSFRQNRFSDEGYLIGRIFVNRENHYFVEGKRQITLKHNNFGTETVDKAALLNIVETAVQYSLEFDLLVPPYDSVKIVSVDQLNSKIESTRIQTGKRLGYKFNSDDI